MKLVVGLGNPGEKYAKTRHNAGYMALDVFSKKYNVDFKYEPRFEGFLGSTSLKGEKIFFLKPTTFMNLSGSSLVKVINYYKIDIEDILILYDDVDIELGNIRLREQGSSGGHNGIKDIIKHLKTENFKRIKIGISKDDDMVDYVLSQFSKKEFEILEQTLDKVSEAVRLFLLNESFRTIMNKYN